MKLKEIGMVVLVSVMIFLFIPVGVAGQELASIKLLKDSIKKIAENIDDIENHKSLVEVSLKKNVELNEREMSQLVRKVLELQRKVMHNNEAINKLVLRLDAMKQLIETELARIKDDTDNEFVPRYKETVAELTNSVDKLKVERDNYKKIYTEAKYEKSYHKEEAKKYLPFTKKRRLHARSFAEAKRVYDENKQNYEDTKVLVVVATTKLEDYKDNNNYSNYYSKLLHDYEVVLDELQNRQLVKLEQHEELSVLEQRRNILAGKNERLKREIITKNKSYQDNLRTILQQQMTAMIAQVDILTNKSY